MSPFPLTSTSLLDYNRYLSLLVGNTTYSPSSFDLLATTTVTGATADTITFSNLSSYSSTYKHLQLRMVMRDNRSGYTGSYARLRFNNDSGSNYSVHALYGTGSGIGSGSEINSTSVHAGEINAPNAPSGAFAPAVLDILDAFSTSKNKTTRLFAGTVNYDWLGLWSGHWRSTAAVDSISIISPLGDFVTGCRFSLYGLKAV